MKHALLVDTLAPASIVATSAHADGTLWSAAKAKTWYAQQRWPVGSNYVHTLEETHHLSIDDRATTDKPTIVNLGGRPHRILGDEGSGSAMNAAPSRAVVASAPDSTSKHPMNGTHRWC
jgi:hypothetical protein